ncbi:MAG: hypothetical protein AB1758_31560 [Candidatus Eremiobacterota bacterium]
MAEALVTLLLFAIALSLIGALVREYGRIFNTVSEREMALEAGLYALERIRSESQEAVAWITPAVGGTGDSPELVFDKLDPAAMPARLPDPPAVAGPWNPLDPADLQRVRYFVDQAGLQREAGGETLPMASAVLSLPASNESDRSVRVHLAVRQGDRTVFYSCRLLRGTR